MALRLVTHAERPDLGPRWNGAADSVWPAFMLHGDVPNLHWGKLARDFPDCQLYLVDDETDEFAGIGNTVPVSWDGTMESLSGGVDDVLMTAFEEADARRTPNTLCALQAALLPSHLGGGLSSVIIRGMRNVAAQRGYASLIAPVRPNQKALYPLTPIERYVRWRRADGLPHDAWLRVHERLGASVLHVAERSMRVSGTVGDWENWTGLVFPESGDYVVTGALCPITIDCDADLGLYLEPNVWMRHPVPGAR
jgi:hypothetical protein